MKKLALLLALLLLTASASLAHQPEKIEIKLTGKRLIVNALHGTKKVDAHYVKSFIVKLDGKKIIEQNYSLQTPLGQIAIYEIPELAGKHSTLTVSATCSIYGTKTEVLELNK
ncbi:hypothetical protein A3K48_02335 [candidate division WOR-1 bacterium RIFOXYA12_FULL_52_29]|uniref:Desulfoferrodoxin ferrous iron-binding domain-containing protein n=1 Tax=candidate division WOR-1 bacterium RIFOXYC12_FULL_54_18 TaxID=1802584 RepID=A0A1F4T541_UNCSA|nr:MAG: hypothetical protein A3K44_02335 [candidate division WOR-1 bacterium RIFOXYA2_FULL_51_19]OGC17411.1 MAG: hypothetical protein A3K48_02335 [candidate division WOR-1 bacterium RIFOXYA12_FULL_52_29]OGC26270.1 MAG: hypothetical protein A3K32_02330 [candidate division WOR-1 bacterium RIFOXYB2_FULL_45_9]OGC27828.1 MAG: hypothetical protein A3K49_02335 [candidate division WOR-1 bacterium RIFOXYC12_FULL_54_18]OGC29883.1 MAG: hypothetical protein A2346_04000 [candidate division WOR-1 bacterium R